MTSFKKDLLEDEKKMTREQELKKKLKKQEELEMWNDIKDYEIIIKKLKENIEDLKMCLKWAQEHKKMYRK